MAEAILEAYKDKKGLSAMRQNARRLAVEKFDRQKIAKEAARILKSYNCDVAGISIDCSRLVRKISGRLLYCCI